MHKTTLYLDEALYVRLMRLAEERGETQAAVVREALHAYLTARAPKKQPRSIGLGRSGRGDLSEKSEELLGGMGEDS
jgi:predicted transcriptional regulator